MSTQNLAGWTTEELCKHVTFIDYRGRTPTKVEQGMRLITAKNVKMGFVQLNPQEFVSPDIYDEWMIRGIPEEGDVLFTTEAPLGNVAQLDTAEKVVIGQRLITMKPDRDVLDPTFLKYALLSPQLQEEILSRGTGATVLGIKSKLLKQILIRYPVIAEQQYIVYTLDQAFTDIEQARAKTEQNLKNARELFESYLQQVFSQRGEGWENKKVSEIADTCLGKMLDKKKNKGNLKPYLRNFNVQWFDISTDDLLEMRFEDPEYERYAIKKGDLVLCEGGYPGRGAIWNKDEDIFFQKALHRIRCHNAIYNRWILYYLFLSDCDGSLKSHFTGAGIQHFTGKALKQLSLPIPPESIAKQFIEKIDCLHSEIGLLEAVYENKSQQLDELKKSILQKAFSGELTKDSEGVAA